LVDGISRQFVILKTLIKKKSLMYLCEFRKNKVIGNKGMKSLRKPPVR
jgi:hypothetical protein